MATERPIPGVLFFIRAQKHSAERRRVLSRPPVPAAAWLREHRHVWPCRIGRVMVPGGRVMGFFQRMIPSLLYKRGQWSCKREDKYAGKYRCLFLSLRSWSWWFVPIKEKNSNRL
jgi:hypothetical protein